MTNKTEKPMTPEEVSEWVWKHWYEIVRKAYYRQDSMHDAVVYLEGWLEGKPEIRVGNYGYGTVPNPENYDGTEIELFTLPHDWDDDITEDNDLIRWNSEEEQYEEREDTLAGDAPWKPLPMKRLLLYWAEEFRLDDRGENSTWNVMIRNIEKQARGILESIALEED